MAEPSGNPPGPPHAARMPHTYTTQAGEDSPRRRQNRRACCVRRSISSILRGVVTRTRNVREYLLVLAVCLVISVGREWSTVATQTKLKQNLNGDIIFLN